MGKMDGEKFETKPSKSSRNPTWRNEEFSVTCDSGAFEYIKFTVEDDDRRSRNRDIGKGELEFESRSVSLWKDLIGEKRGKKCRMKIDRDVELICEVSIEAVGKSGGAEDWGERE